MHFREVSTWYIVGITMVSKGGLMDQNLATNLATKKITYKINCK